MSYEVWIVRSAQKQLAAVPRADYERVRDAIWAGDFRVIYEIEDRTHRVTVIHIGRRRDVYR